MNVKQICVYVVLPHVSEIWISNCKFVVLHKYTEWIMGVGRTHVNISHGYVQHQENVRPTPHSLMIYITFRINFEIMLVYVMKVSPSYHQTWNQFECKSSHITEIWTWRGEVWNVCPSAYVRHHAVFWIFLPYQTRCYPNNLWGNSTSTLTYHAHIKK